MLGSRIELITIRQFNDPPQVHYRNAVRDVAYYAQIMRYKEIRQIKLILQLLQQIEYLRPHGDIERRHRFVENDKFGIDRKSTCYRDTLPLPTTKLVGVAIYVI